MYLCTNNIMNMIIAEYRQGKSILRINLPTIVDSFTEDPNINTELKYDLKVVSLRQVPNIFGIVLNHLPWYHMDTFLFKDSFLELMNQSFIDHTLTQLKQNNYNTLINKELRIKCNFHLINLILINEIVIKGNIKEAPLELMNDINSQLHSTTTLLSLLSKYELEYNSIRRVKSYPEIITNEMKIKFETDLRYRASLAVGNEYISL